MSAPDTFRSSGQPRLNAYAVIESDTYPVVELRTLPCTDGGPVYAVRCFPLDGEGFDETEPTTCPQLAAMLWLQASGAEIEIVLGEVG